MRVQKVWGLALATAAVAIASATTARADERIIAKVPFAFVVHDTRLPAGEYMLKTLSDDPSVWVIASADGKQTGPVPTIAGSSSSASGKAELVFDKFDNQYFLSKVVPSDDQEREIPLTPARMERDVIKLALEP